MYICILPVRVSATTEATSPNAFLARISAQSQTEMSAVHGASTHHYYSYSSESSNSVLPKSQSFQYQASSNYVGQKHAVDLPEAQQQVTKLERTNQTSPIPAHRSMRITIAQARDKTLHKHASYSGDDRYTAHTAITSTAAPPTATTITRLPNTTKIETATAAAQAMPHNETAFGTTTLVNIESKATQFSRDRLFHANVSTTAHAFFDLFKLRSNRSGCSSTSSTNNINRCNSSESKWCTLSESNRNSSVENRVAAMRLNVPDCTTANGAVTEIHHSVPSIPINHIDSNVVHVNNNLIITANGVQPSTSPTVASSTATVSTTMLTPPANIQTSSHVFENGTLMGTIIAQPSLTIQVNQSEKHSQTNLNIHHHHQQQQLQVGSISYFIFFLQSVAKDATNDS